MCTSRDGMEHQQQGRTDHAIDMLEQTWDRVLALLDRVRVMLNLQPKWDKAKAYAVEHPVTTLFGLMLACMCSVPIMCFLAFACGTLFLTFMGFLCVEGFLLTVGGVLLGGVLFIVGFVSVGLSSFLAIAWYAIAASQKIIHNVTGGLQGTASRYRMPFNLLGFENANGECVKDIGSEKDD